MIHRDVKPENVLLADDGRVKVADFGLARAISAETQHTATGGVLIGTVSYLSPELVVDGKADARSDVYAAGVVLYEMLTGRKPHEGESPIQVAYKHVHEDVPAALGDRPRPPARTSTRSSPAPPPATASCARPTRGCCCTRSAGSGPRSTTALVDDPELTADLTPTRARCSAAPTTTTSTTSREDGADDPHAGAGRRTAAAPTTRASSATGPHRPPPARAAAARAAPRAADPAARRRGPILLVLVLLLAVAPASAAGGSAPGATSTPPASST